MRTCVMSLKRLCYEKKIIAPPFPTYQRQKNTMKFATSTLVFASAIAATCAFAPASFSGRPALALDANIRDKSEKADDLAFGWDGTTALGGAVEIAAPARMLEDIRAAGESVPSECEVFNANVEMDADALTFEEVMEVIDTHFETGLIEFKNGDILNKQGENEGSAKVLSYAALSNFDKETTLKLWGQYYREVLADPDGDSHQNIRNFMKYGWDGTYLKSCSRDEND